MYNRLILCLLLCGLMLYYAVPNLSIHAGGLEAIFSIGWLLFALAVIGGNLVGLLYTPKRKKHQQVMSKNQQVRARIRQYQ